MNSPQAPERQPDYGLLLVVLGIHLFVLLPFVASGWWRVLVLEASLALAVVTGSLSVALGRNGARTALALTAILIVMQSTALFSDHALLSTFSLMILASFFAFFSFRILRQVFSPGRVTRHRIMGAVCVYLLIAMFFALMFRLAERQQPDAWSGIVVSDQASSDSRYDLVYLSIVTLTTLGFGDITPHSNLARALVTLEALVGQFYMAVLVARLVGLHILHSSSDPDV